MKAADIPDIEMLEFIDGLKPGRIPKWNLEPYWITRSEILLPEVEYRFRMFPVKVVRAKLARMIKRGLLNGCACGCRGEFEVTEKGRQVMEDDS